MERGSLGYKALDVINGERQDQYGDPEDSFGKIAEYWSTYIQSMVPPKFTGEDVIYLGAKDVAMMMALLKIAREANQHKEDNIVDAIGYLALAGDM